MVDQWRVTVQQNSQGKWKYDIPLEDAAELRKAGWEGALNSVYAEIMMGVVITL